MCLEVVLSIDNIVLMNAGVPVCSSDRVFWFIDEIQENVSGNVFLRKGFVSIIDSEIMIIPNAHNFCS